MSQVVCVFVCVDGNGVVMLTHRVLIDSRHLLLTVLQAESPRSGHQHGRVLVTVFLVADACLPLRPLMWRAKSRSKLSHGSSYKGTNLMTEGSTLLNSLPPQSLPPNTTTLGIRTSTYGFRGTYLVPNHSPHIFPYCLAPLLCFQPPQLSWFSCLPVHSLLTLPRAYVLHVFPCLTLL